MERNCIRRPTLLASPTTNTSQPPLQKCVRGRLGERPPAQQPPLQKMRARHAYPTNNVCAASSPTTSLNWASLPYPYEKKRACLATPKKN